jgi:hypothetical protein
MAQMAVCSAPELIIASINLPLVSLSFISL